MRRRRNAMEVAGRQRKDEAISDTCDALARQTCRGWGVGGEEYLFLQDGRHFEIVLASCGSATRT
jgi:hypothetical protein